MISLKYNHFEHKNIFSYNSTMISPRYLQEWFELVTVSPLCPPTYH